MRLSLFNRTRMWHPIHLHGHTFALSNDRPAQGHRDRAPAAAADRRIDADNPGLWMLHCHNVYHSECGMMTVLGYRS